MKRCEGHNPITGECCEAWGTLGYGVRNLFTNQAKAKTHPSIWVCGAHKSIGEAYLAKVNAE